MPIEMWSPFDSPWPPPNWDITRLLDHPKGEESYTRAYRERHRRIADLRKNASSPACELASTLTQCAIATRCLSAACPICFERARIWFCAQAAQILGVDHAKLRSKVTIITLVSEDWRLPRGRIREFTPKPMLDQVRHQLLRVGAKGAVVLGAVHGEYDQSRDSHVYRPMVTQRLNAPERQISYLFKSYWPMRVRFIGPHGRSVSAFQRIPGPLHSAYLTMLDRSRLLDFLFLFGVRRYGHELRRNSS
jgi:hypothetical protein